MPVSALLYDSIPRGHAYLGDYSDRIKNLKCVTRDVGGYWSATANFVGSRAALDDMFYRGLLRELRVKRSGFEIWEGFLGAMTYTRDGIPWTQSIGGLANAVRALYTRIGDNMLSNPGAESGAWTAVNGATVTQSSDWVTEGTYSCKIVVADTTVRGADVEASIAIVDEAVYNVSIDLHVTAGSWRVAINRTDTDAKIAAKSTKGQQGNIKIQFSVPVTNTYAGTVRFRITSEAAAGTVYCDNAVLQLSTVPATTNWKVDLNSIKEFSRIENILNLNFMTAETANGRAANVLRESAWPICEPPDNQIGLGAAQTADSLQLTFFGYIFSTRWIYSNFYATDTMTNYVTAALVRATLLQRGIVKTNSTLFQVDSSDPITLWKALSEMAASGQESGTGWRLGVYNDRKLNYQPIDPDILYTIKAGKAYDKGGHPYPAYLAKPGWAEFVDAPRSPNSLSTDANRKRTRLYIAEIEYNADTDQAVYRRVPGGDNG